MAGSALAAEDAGAQKTLVVRANSIIFWRVRDLLEMKLLQLLLPSLTLLEDGLSFLAQG